MKRPRSAKFNKSDAAFGDRDLFVLCDDMTSATFAVHVNLVRL